MIISDRNKINMLYDFYCQLLTKRQRELFELRFQFDLSLGEIASNLSISRQGVHDQLRRTSQQLFYYEDLLNLLAKHELRQQNIFQIEEALTAGNLNKARFWLKKMKNL